MKIYNFDPATAEYLGEEDASLDPLESENAGQDVYITPAHSTPDQPPATVAGEIAVRVGAAWVIKEDHRGKTVYSQADKSALEIEDIGPLPAGYTEAVPGEFDSWQGNVWVTDTVQELANAQALKLNEVNNAADTALFSVTNAYPKSERISWDKQETEARAWQADNQSPTPLLDAIGAARGMDKATLVTKVIGKADIFAGLAGTVFGLRQGFEDQVIAAADTAAVNAIVVSFGP